MLVSSLSERGPCTILPEIPIHFHKASEIEHSTGMSHCRPKPCENHSTIILDWFYAKHGSKKTPDIRKMKRFSALAKMVILQRLHGKMVSLGLEFKRPKS